MADPIEYAWIPWSLKIKLLGEKNLRTLPCLFLLRNFGDTVLELGADLSMSLSHYIKILSEKPKRSTKTSFC